MGKFEKFPKSEEKVTGSDNLQIESAINVHHLTQEQARVFVRLLYSGDLSKPQDLNSQLSEVAEDDIDTRAKIISEWVKKNSGFVSENS